MDLTPSARTQELQRPLADFIADRVDPAYAVYRARRSQASGDPHFHPPVMEDLKAEARAARPVEPVPPRRGATAPGSATSSTRRCASSWAARRSRRRPRTARAPDTGNMEILAEFGTPLQRSSSSQPLLDGEIRSCFAMTEPWVASSDATNIQSRIERDGDHYVINAHKWWTSGAASERCTFAILMGVSDPDADPHRRHSDDHRAARHAGRHDRAHAARVRARRRRRPLRDAVRERARPEGVPARRGGRRLRDRAGAARPRSHPSLHARDRHGRAGASSSMCTRAQMRVAFGKHLADQGVDPGRASPSRASRSSRRGCSR